MRLPVIAIGLGLAGCAPAMAADPFYFGVWKFVAATPAPWADPKAPLDANEARRILGKTITIRSAAIAGPPTFACKPATFKLVDYGPDMLFQGAFGEMQSRDKSADPAKLAASVGLMGATVQTLETGCEFDWHFVSEREMKTGLNDYVYTLTKQ